MMTRVAGVIWVWLRATLVLLVCIELIAYAYLDLRPKRPVLGECHLNDDTKSQAWGPILCHEESLVAGQPTYEPYALWRYPPYKGQTIDIDEDGLRHTDYSRCDAGAYTIWMFGGSALWGSGSPDSGTIPSLLANAYASRGHPVCIRNFGMLGWVSNQELVALVLMLKRSDIAPKLVIFYDGINDVLACWQYRRPGLHLHVEVIRERLESISAPPTAGSFFYLRNSNVARAVLPSPSLALSMSGMPAVPHPDYLAAAGPAQKTTSGAANALVSYYLRNLQVVAALAQQYGFRYAFFWQPALWAEHKPLSDEEKAISRIQSNSVAGITSFFPAVYERMRSVRQPHLYYIGDAFNNVRTSLYLDYAHISPRGNAIVVQRMFTILRADKRAFDKSMIPKRD